MIIQLECYENLLGCQNPLLMINIIIISICIEGRLLIISLQPFLFSSTYHVIKYYNYIFYW